MHGALAAAGALRQGNTCRGTARCCLLSQVGLPVHTVDRTATRGAGRHGLYRALRHVQRAFRPRLRGDGRRRHAPDSWRPGTFRHTGPSQNSPPPPRDCPASHNILALTTMDVGSHHDLHLGGSAPHVHRPSQHTARSTHHPPALASVRAMRGVHGCMRRWMSTAYGRRLGGARGRRRCAR